MPKKRTRDDFIERARAVHGDRYDYSKVVYKGSHEKVCIICPKHGEFWQDPTNHISRKSNCPKCSYELISDLNRSDTESFIAKARKRHGDKYDYSKVVYRRTDEKVCIVCPEHGEFWQEPHNHIQGAGCPKCSNMYSPSTEEFIAAARAVHGDKYDYSKAVYNGNKRKLCVVCPEHGEFWITPNNHISKKVGCSRCTGYYDLTIEEFIDEANKRFNNKYDYSKAVWRGFQKKIEIICPEHGSFFQTPMSHLKTMGCGKCSGKYMDQDYFIEKATRVHKGKYDYSKVVYTGNKDKVCIICPEHGAFWQKPNQHLMGAGCAICAGNYLNTELFKQKAARIHDNKYDYSLVEYTGGLKKVKIICPTHGVFEQVASYHLAGNGCPMCNESHIERDVRRFLKHNFIQYESEKTFEWLVYEDKMFLDFFLPQYGVAIECQGGQHFEAVDLWGGEEKYEVVKARDRKKKQLCNEHGIEIIYYSNLGIDFPYPVIRDFNHLLEAIKARGDIDPILWKDPELPLVFD